MILHVREPFNKNSIWLKPNQGNLDVLIYENGWKTIFSNKDMGLSLESQKQVEGLVETLRDEIADKLKKSLGKQNSSAIKLLNKVKEQDNKILELEEKLEKLTKRYQALSVKLNSNGK